MHLSCTGLSSSITPVIHCACEQHVESRESGTWSCGEGSRGSTTVMTQGKTITGKEPYCSANVQSSSFVQTCTVSVIYRVPLWKERRQKIRSHFRHELTLYLTKSITWLETREYCIILTLNVGCGFEQHKNKDS